VEEESNFLEIFIRLSEAYDACPQDIKRSHKNFLHYSYMFYKLCELLGYMHLLLSIKLPRSEAVVYGYNLIWKFMRNCAFRTIRLSPSSTRDPDLSADRILW
jgi:hypothetical protein